MKRIKVERIMKDGKCLILAYDQGFEHGPHDLNAKTVDPNFVLDIALEGRYTAIAIHAGIADKYFMSYFKDVPLLIKLNGKTNFDKENPLALQHTSVKHALDLGAAAVGYTLYIGSGFEQQMFVELGKICDEAHNAGIPVVCWVRFAGHLKEDTNTIAYGARIAMEIGVDFVNVPYNHDSHGMNWVVKCAGKTKVLVAGGEKKSQKEFLDMVQEVLRAGAVGVMVGRNIWQSEQPFEATKALKKVIFEDKSAEIALKK